MQSHDVIGSLVIQFAFVKIVIRCNDIHFGGIHVQMPLRTDVAFHVSIIFRPGILCTSTGLVLITTCRHQPVTRISFLTTCISDITCFSVVTTAFAATPDETSDSDLISDIKQAMLDTYYGDEKPEYLNVEILLDDEDEVYFSFSDSFATSANRVYTEAGNYIVSYLENCPVALYKNNRVYMIPDAYNSGIIDDDTLEGLTYCGHMDIVPKSDDSALVIEIKNKVIEECFDGKSPETLRIDIVGRTSDGGVCFRYSFGGGMDVIVEETIGDYTYSYNHGDDVMLYKNGNVYSIKEAYEVIF